MLKDDVSPEAGTVDPPCLACGVPAYCVVWDHRLCAECFDSLQAVEAFTSESIGTDEHKAFCAEATRRTRAWVDARRGQKRAAG